MSIKKNLWRGQTASLWKEWHEGEGEIRETRESYLAVIAYIKNILLIITCARHSLIINMRETALYMYIWGEGPRNTWAACLPFPRLCAAMGRRCLEETCAGAGGLPGPINGGDGVQAPQWDATRHLYAPWTLRGQRIVRGAVTPRTWDGHPKKRGGERRKGPESHRRTASL